VPHSSDKVTSIVDLLPSEKKQTLGGYESGRSVEAPIATDICLSPFFFAVNSKRFVRDIRALSQFVLRTYRIGHKVHQDLLDPLHV